MGRRGNHREFRIRPRRHTLRERCRPLDPQPPARRGFALPARHDARADGGRKLPRGAARRHRGRRAGTARGHARPPHRRRDRRRHPPPRRADPADLRRPRGRGSAATPARGSPPRQRAPPPGDRREQRRRRLAGLRARRADALPQPCHARNPGTGRDRNAQRPAVPHLLRARESAADEGRIRQADARPGQQLRGRTGRIARGPADGRGFRGAADGAGRVAHEPDRHVHRHHPPPRDGNRPPPE